MSSNPYIQYYANQAGSGIGGFQGARFQKGQGFFGNVFKSAILPLLKYFGKKALVTGAEVATDAIGGENIMNSLKTRGKSIARTIASDAGNRAIKFAQTGKGRKRRRKRPVKKVKRTKVVRKRRRKSRKSRKSLKNIQSIFN